MTEYDNSRPKYYALDGQTPVPVEGDDVIAWAKEFEKGDTKRVAYIKFPNGIEVSTVFLGLDHNYDPDPASPPLLFETMIFNGPEDGYQERYSTWAEAVAGHEKAVEVAKKMKVSDG